MRPVLYIGCPSFERSDAERSLSAAGLSVLWAETSAHALGELGRRDMPVLVDLSRGPSALQIAREIKTSRAQTILFCVADIRRTELTTDAILNGVADVFARPLSGKRVTAAIERELALESRKPAPVSPVTADDLYSQSAAMQNVMTLVAKAASMRAGVMIRGEDGTGRQVVARAIHGSGPAASHKFISVDCAAFDGDDLELELFGVSANSNGSAGPNYAANGIERVSDKSRAMDSVGGTLYLQNLVEAPARVQSRIAKLLRDREAVRAETGHVTPMDLRAVVSLDDSAASAVQDGRMREDLWRRVSVIRIDMPALRNRREDIPALANFILRDVSCALRVPPKQLSRPAMSLLSALPWRGNAIELRGLLEHVVSSQSEREISVDDVLKFVKLDSGAAVYAAGGTLRQARARFEREYIAAVLDQYHGRIAEAAKTLGIQRTNLYRKMRTLRVARKPRKSV